MIFPAEFIKALQMLPEKEKDKLILRLLKHDLQLANQLLFKLVSTDSVEDRRKGVKADILRRIQNASEHYYSAGYLLMDIREVSGIINEHVSITKDKFGEISLTCLMLRSMLELNHERIALEPKNKAYTLCIYVIARVFKILLLIQKQHEDFYIDFRDDIEAIGLLIKNNPNLMKLATSNKLSMNWLLRFEIPDNLAEIHTRLRKEGLLK